MFYDSGKGGVFMSFLPMTRDAAMCTAYYEQGYRAGLTLPAHAIRPLEDAACAQGYCDCFCEGYMQGITEREQRPINLHIADAIVRGGIDRA